MEYNEKHGITPQTVRRAVQESLHTILRGREIASSVINEAGGNFDLTELLRELEDEMQRASANLEFERAALLRDQIMEVKSGTGLTKIEPKRRPVKYTRNNGRRRSRVWVRGRLHLREHALEAWPTWWRRQPLPAIDSRRKEQNKRSRFDCRAARSKSASLSSGAEADHILLRKEWCRSNGMEMNLLVSDPWMKEHGTSARVDEVILVQ